MHWPIDHERIKQCYQDDGYVLLESFFSADEIQEIHEVLRRYVANVVPTLPSMDVFYQEKGNQSTIKMLPRMHRHEPFVEALLSSGRLPEIAEALWSTEAVPHDAAFFDKPAGAGEPTPPHQDGYYFHIQPCEAMTMWLALDDVDEQNGCVRYVPGSHHRAMRPHARTEVLGFSQGITDFGDADRQAEVAVCVKPGDLIIHDAMTIHRADGNRSKSRSRQALGFVYFSSRARVDQAAVDQYQQNLSNEWKVAGKI